MTRRVPLHFYMNAKVGNKKLTKRNSLNCPLKQLGVLLVKKHAIIILDSTHKVTTPKKEFPSASNLEPIGPPKKKDETDTVQLQ